MITIQKTKKKTNKQPEEGIKRKKSYGQEWLTLCHIWSDFKKRWWGKLFCFESYSR